MTPAIASNGTQYLHAVLSIDIGSTETRVVIVWYDGAKVQKLIIENLADAYTPLNTLAQFSSRVLVHDANPIKYIGNERQVHREESSAKFIPYILTAKNERSLEQYLILERLWHERRKVGSKAFHERLEEAFNQFLCFVLKRTKCALETYSSNDKHIQIKTVAMTIPSQWDLNFEELYRRLFKRAFLQTFNYMPHMATHDFGIVFHTEATALAHYIFHESSHEAALGGGMPRIGTILNNLNAQCFIDCGGHNANSIVTQFHPNKDGQAVLYELGKAQGAGVGSEMLIHHLMKRLVDDYRVERNDQADLPQSFYQALKRGTTTSLGSFTQEARQSVTCENPRGLGGPVVLEINREMCEEAFEAGFKHVKDMIESQLQELARISQGWGDTMDDTYQDDTRHDDTDSSDTDSDEDYHNNADNAIVSGSARPSQSCSLGNSHDGPVPVLRRSISPCPQYSSGDDEKAYNDDSGGQNIPADVAQQTAAISNAVASSVSGNTNESSATKASTSTSMISSPGRGRIASKADTARAASRAFRSSKQVSGRMASNSQTSIGVSQGMSTSTPTARPRENIGHNRSENVPRTGDASSSSYPGSFSMTPGSQSGLSARNKRPAPTEGDNRRSTKRIHTGGDDAADYPSQRASRPGPAGNLVASYPAAENSASFESRRDPPARRGNGDYYRPSANAVRLPSMATPSRRPVTAQNYSGSNRYRDRDSEFSVHHGMAGLNLNQGVPTSGSPPRGPTAHTPRRQDTAAPSNTPAGSSGPSSRPLHVDSPSPRPGSSYRPARNPGPSGTSQQPPGFNGRDPADRRARPPWRQ